MAVRKINESHDDKFYVGWAKVNSDELYDWLGDSHKIYLHDDGKYYAGTSKDSPNSYQIEDRAVLSLKRDPRFKNKFVESLSEARDFDWNQKLWCVVKDDGRFAGSPCLTPGEARELSYQHDGSKIYKMELDPEAEEY